MAVLTFSRPHRLDQLADELVAALPGLIVVRDGRRTAAFTLTSAAEAITIDLPDGIDAATVAAVVAAHVPTAPPPPPAAPSAADLAQLRAFMAGGQPTTIAQLAAVVRTFVQLYRYRSGRDE